MANDIPIELTNDSGETIDQEGVLGFGLGTEDESAFRRGREWCRGGYTFSQARSAVKKKTKQFPKMFQEGWKWQSKR